MDWCRLIQLLTAMIAVVIFTMGFMPYKQQISGYAKHKCCQRSKFSSVILFVVDALKTEFVVKDQADNWPYLHRLIQTRKAKVYNARVHPPTVTLPRVKALISGDIPGFVDVLMNFNSAELKSDNLLHQLNASGYKSVFYGDDTWLKLFPDMFLRSDGTTSFYVSDYTEVDSNITRHLDDELGRSDWTLMVLHYLGLDHIGHIYGPYSNLVPPKLQEMDNVLRKLHSSFEKKNMTDYLIIVCGDHGMADQGGHGGVTVNEVSTPMVFINHAPFSNSDTVDDIYQIDLVPTLSALLSVPVPQNNLGVSITPLLRSLLEHEQLLSALQFNTRQLMRLSEDDEADGDIKTRYEMLATQHELFLRQSGAPPSSERLDRLLSGYDSLMSDLRSRLASQLVTYDVHAMVAGFLIMFTVMLCQVVGYRQQWNAVYISILTAVSLTLSSVYYTLCTAVPISSEVLCYKPLGISALLLEILVTSAAVCSIFEYSSHWKSCPPVSRGRALLVLPLCHSLSLLSSSFIEEEHQIVYFFTSSLLSLILISSLLTQSPATDSSSWHIVITMLCAALARKWNQTGDKWAHLPDIADWLSTPENLSIRLILSQISLVIVISMIITRRHIPHYAKLLSAISTLATSLFVLQDCGYTSVASRGGIYEADTVYLCVVGMVLITLLHRAYRNRSLEVLQTAWLLLTCLMHRTVNVPLAALSCLMEYFLSSVDMGTDTAVHLYYWLGQSLYFCQGNSNNLRTMDIAAGYKGLTAYNQMVTGSLIVCNAYSAPVFWIISLCKRLSQDGSQRDTNLRKAVGGVLWLYLQFKFLDMVMLMFLIILERYHLFVWTVFAPKLFYEINFISLLSIGYFLYEMCSSILFYMYTKDSTLKNK